MDKNEYVWVRRQFNDYRDAKYHLDNFENPHWDTVSGGVNSVALQPFIHGYVICNEMIEGELAHSGTHGPCPHRIKVCVVKKVNDPDVYNYLLGLVGPSPRYRSKPSSGHWCKTDILEMFKSSPVLSRKTIVEAMVDIGHSKDNAVAVLKKLDKNGKLVSEKDPSDRRTYIYRLP